MTICMHAKVPEQLIVFYATYRIAISWAVCPDLTRERYAHNANSSTCVRMVARTAQCVSCTKWFSEFSLVEGSLSRRENQRNRREPLRTAKTLRCARNHSHARTAVGVVCVTFACQIWTHCSWEVSVLNQCTSDKKILIFSYISLVSLCLFSMVHTHKLSGLHSAVSRLAYSPVELEFKMDMRARSEIFIGIAQKYHVN